VMMRSDAGRSCKRACKLPRRFAASLSAICHWVREDSHCGSETRGLSPK
jgi:hypothetical protein